jgi:hypothetical protein
MCRKILCAAVVGLGVLATPAISVSSETPGGETSQVVSIDPLLGVWDVEVTPTPESAEEGRQAFSDRVLFESSRAFTAEAFGPMGFATTVATLESVQDSVGFRVTQSNGEQGTLRWNGVLLGSQIVGVLIWTRDGDTFTYNFVATRPED